MDKVWKFGHVHESLGQNVSNCSELELLSKAGLSNLDVLRAATCVPASVFRLHDRGTIEAGKRADLVLVHGTPLTDLTATRRIRQAWIEGVGVEVEMELAVKAEVEGKA